MLKRKIYNWIIKACLLVIACVFSVYLVGCSSSKVFEIDGLNITLTSEFIEKSHVEFTACYTSDDIVVGIIREDYDDLEKAGVNPNIIDRSGYLHLVKRVYEDGLKNESDTVKEDGLVYFTYEHDALGKDFKVLCCAYKSSEAYYSIQFGCHKSNFDRLEKTMLKYAKSVELEGANELEFKKISGKEEYYVAGMGTLEDTEIVVPAEHKGLPVTAIGREAFKSKQLKKITLPETITEIQDNAFNSCYKMESITLGNNITSIGASAFSGCKLLTSFSFPGGVTTIGYGAFQGCEGFTEITLPESLVSLGGACFAECEKLEKITFPSTITKIGARAFENCESLTEVVIPDSVTSIGEELFYCCQNLKKATLGNGITALTYGIFSSCNKLENVIFSAGVTVIESSAFSQCTQLKEISSMESVTRIGDYAFSHCQNLKNVTFSKVLQNIGERAFSECAVLSNVSFPDTLNSIGWSAFEYCFELTEIVFPDSLTSLGSMAFYGCKNLTSVKVGSGLKELYDSVFSQCDNLLEIELSETLTFIGENAFNSCKSLSHVTIPDSVTTISENAFNSCEKLETVTLGKGLEEIEDSDSIYSVFYGCKNLKMISVKPENKNYQSIDGNLYTKDGKTLIRYAVGKTQTSCEFPEDVSVIATAAFYGATALQKVVLPSTLTVIQNYAFASCEALNNVHLPYGIDKIGEYTFSYCVALKEIVIPYGVTLSSNMFNRCVGVTVYCENASLPTSWGISESYLFGSATVVWGYNNVNTNPEYDYVIHGDTVCLTKYKGEANEIVIPAEIDGHTVVDFGEIFANNTSIMSIKIPEGITSVPQNAFNNCKLLIKAELPNSLTEIGFRAFYECRSLLEIVIPKNVKLIAKEAFSSCELMKTIVFLGDVESVDEYSFSSCSALKNVYYKGDKVKGEELYNANFCLRSANWYYYSETEPTDDGNYWHYVDGVPTVWVYSEEE